MDYRANQTAGLGSSANLGVSLDNVHSSAQRAQRTAKTRERFQQIEQTPKLGNPQDASKVQLYDDGDNLNIGETKKQTQWVQGQTQNPT